MKQKKLLSLVVPVYFEEECIDQFILECTNVLKTLNLDYEIVFIDDGSKDRTIDIISSYADEDDKIKLIAFSYNQGKQTAVTAGISFASGDYMIYMDPDLQDPPEEIPRFLEEIEKGYDLVFGIRRSKEDTFINRGFSKIFWFVLERFTGLKIPTNLAVMRIFNRKFANKFLEYKEQNRFIEGIFMHIGMNRSVLEIEQRRRFAGKSKFNFKRKMKLAFDAILDYSEIPLKLSVRLGATLSLLGLLALSIIVILSITLVEFQAGWPSLFSLLVIGFGVQLFFTGIAALYIGNIYRETKNRPLFSIKKTLNLNSDNI